MGVDYKFLSAELHFSFSGDLKEKCSTKKKKSTSVFFRVISCQEADAETELLTKKKAQLMAFLSRRYRRLWTVDKRVWPGLIAQCDEGPSSAADWRGCQTGWAWFSENKEVAVSAQTTLRKLANRV